MRDNVLFVTVCVVVVVVTSVMTLCISSPPTESVILALKVQELTGNKLRFRHNVSLTVSLTVGSPPQSVTMVLDTGSELSWLHCDNSQIQFVPAQSTSYSPFKCSSPVCTVQTKDFPIRPSCDRTGLCHVTLSYADFSSAEGDLASDVFSLSRDNKLVFGCMSSGFSSSPEEDSKSSGLIGMNLGSLSLVSQFKFPKFSYCISSQQDVPGVLVLGGGTPTPMPALSYTPMVRTSDPLPSYDRMAYTVRLSGIEVGGVPVPVPPNVFVPDHTGAGQTMVDSGTQFTFLLGPVYQALKKEISNRVNMTPVDFVFQGAMDLCYLIPTANPKPPPLPPVTLVFDGARISVSGETLLYRVPGLVRGTNSVHCVTFGNSDLLGVEAYLIGHHHQQNMWMEFDLQRSRIGIAPTRCDLVAQQLLIS